MTITEKALIESIPFKWRLPEIVGDVDWTGIVERLNSCKKYYPRFHDIFNALKLNPENVKVVILGQDPYHDGSAHGYAFSCESSKTPASLRNIFKEIIREYDMPEDFMPQSNNLMKWVDEGVLLLNTILTVEPKKPKSHAKIGWEVFTTNIVRYISQNYKDVIFLAWGKDAQDLVYDNKEEHKNVWKIPFKNIISAGHPSPLNTTKPFYGCDCFTDCNDRLVSRKVLPIRWKVLW